MWIRSQYKKILGNYSVFCVVDEKYRRYKYFTVYGDSVGLGSYATEQRALEVLDEIQKFIENSDNKMYEYLHSESPKIEYTYKQKTVYEMPKE